MKKETLTLPSAADGLPLSILITLPEESPRALVQLSHGMSEYKERYLPFMEYLTQRGFACIINDHRGHGQSVRSREDLGYFGEKGKGADLLLRDLHQVTGVFKARFPGLPLFLFGHSMGSLAVRCYARRWDEELSGLMVCGCPGENNAAPLGIGLARVLGALLGQHYRSRLLAVLMFGGYNRTAKVHGRNAWICANEEMLKEYNQDPLCGFLFTVNGVESLLRLMRECYSTEGWTIGNPDMPIHFISGGNDPCRISDEKFEAAGQQLRLRGYRSVTQKLYPGLRHEILNEGVREVWEDAGDVLCAWADACTQA